MNSRPLFPSLVIVSIALSGLALQTVSAANKETAREIHLHLGPSSDQPIVKPFRKQPPPLHRVTVTGHRRVPGPSPRQRHPEISSEQLIVVGLDADGREISRVVIADPRLVRAETAGPSGELTSEVFYREEAELTIALPDDPGLSMIKIYHPRWTSKEFILEPIGETPLP